jgi:hypothetical protein
MKQVKDTYPGADFPVPPGLQAVELSNGLFDHDERYFLTDQQRAMVGHEADGEQANSRRNFFDKFLDFFR